MFAFVAVYQDNNEIRSAAKASTIVINSYIDTVTLPQRGFDSAINSKSI